MRTMSLFEIAVPVKDNAGDIVPEGRHFAFETIIMQSAGGYTAMPPDDGAWRDDKGHIYYDRMRSYRVMCDRETLVHMVEAAERIYADQVAFFVAEIGRAWVVPAKMKPGQVGKYLLFAGGLAKV